MDLKKSQKQASPASQSGKSCSTVLNDEQRYGKCQRMPCFGCRVERRLKSLWGKGLERWSGFGDGF